MLNDQEIWLKNCHLAKERAIDSLSLEEVCEYDEFFAWDDIKGARKFLLSHAQISEEDKTLLQSYWKYN